MTSPSIDTQPAASVRVVPLAIETPRPVAVPQPVTMGIPVPTGLLREPARVDLRDDADRPVACQTRPLARWPDGSVRWLLLDFLVPALPQPRVEWSLRLNAMAPSPAAAVVVEQTATDLGLDTGTVRFRLGRAAPTVAAWTEAAWALSADGDPMWPVAESLDVEAAGPGRATARYQGWFSDRCPLNYSASYHVYAGTGLLRVDFLLRNPRRARHPGGLWDLGDPGSYFFRDFSLRLPLPGTDPIQTRWSLGPEGPTGSLAGENLEIYQDSSGGENWQSTNHVTRNGTVPCRFRGYRVRAGAAESTGLRATPTVQVTAGGAAVSVAVPDFWQQFPKAIDVADRTLFVRLFPGQAAEPYELQGGEQKTHTLWLDLTGGSLDWVHAPVRVTAPPEWYEEAGVLPHLAAGATNEPLANQVKEVLDGPRSFYAGRETIDEYGWRNYGDVFADHEEEHYPGPKPFISHYNNQYDIIFGLLQQHFRTGRAGWLDLALPLARHVRDIDVYHTRDDRAAYNGGLFWMTDHYLTAHTSSHRTYSRHNQPPGKDYGGGPASPHLFTTGLLLCYYQTGDPLFREVVLELADWVVAMDDGTRTILGLVDPGPTGVPTGTLWPNYHGPSRSCGNAVNALVDGWLLAGNRAYLDKAEELIRRCVHPADDVAAYNLLDAEKFWSYTVCLTAVARYLSAKAEAGELDAMYAYARASLLQYAAWMVEHEVPYFDRIEHLEYPTEAWPGQELRKANVLRLAAEHADEPLRGRLLARGQQLADRAWEDLYRFESRTTARAQALVLAEGPRDDYFRRREARRLPAGPAGVAFPPPSNFVPQKQRVRAQLRRPLGLAAAVVGLLNPVRWLRYLKR